MWIAGSKAAEWKNGKIEILHAPSGRFDQSVFKYMRKSIPKLNFAKEEMGNVAPTAPDSGGIQYQAPVLGQKKKKKKQMIKVLWFLVFRIFLPPFNSFHI